MRKHTRLTKAQRQHLLPQKARDPGDIPPIEAHLNAASVGEDKGVVHHHGQHGLAFPSPLEAPGQGI